jgi:hypothetical protein
VVSCANRIIDVREPLRSIVDAVRTIDAVRTAHRILRIHEFYGITDIGTLTVWDSLMSYKIRWLFQMVVLLQQRLNGDSYYPRITRLGVCLTRLTRYLVHGNKSQIQYDIRVNSSESEGG